MPIEKQIIYAGSVSAGAKASVSGQGEGIYTLCLDENGSLSRLSVIPSRNSGIITALHHQFVYAANEEKDFGGLNGSGGGVSAYQINEDGSLAFLNSSISYGSRTAYVYVSESGKYLLAANHGSHTTVTCSYVQDENGKWVLKRGFDDSSVALFKLNSDGSIGELSDLKVFKGKGYWCYGGGQSTAHIHCVKERNGFVYAINRGCDEIIVMKLDESDGKLEVKNHVKTRYGYAPRHADFHPSRNILYVVNENYPSVSVYEIDEEQASLCEIQLIGTMDEEYYKDHPLPSFTKPHCAEGETNTSAFGDRSAAMCSDIHISPDGKHLYVSNRRFASLGSLSVFDVHEDGTLSLKQLYGLSGKDPRGFQVSPDGSFLIVGLIDQNLAQVFRLDEEGRISELINELETGSPSSFAF